MHCVCVRVYVCISRADLNRSNRWKHRVAEKKERFWSVTIGFYRRLHIRIHIYTRKYIYIYRSDVRSPGEINRGSPFFWHKSIRVGNIAFSAGGSTKGQIRMTPLYAFRSLALFAWKQSNPRGFPYIYRPLPDISIAHERGTRPSPPPRMPGERDL